MSAHAHPDRLETHYRRLLAVYPPGYRTRYGEEMIGVLMAASPPGHPRPSIRESSDLVLSGLRVRLGAGGGGGLFPAARSAAAVFGFLSSVALAAMFLYHAAAAVAGPGPIGMPWPGWRAELPHGDLAIGVCWALVAGALAAGLRWVAALGAVLGFAGEVVILGRAYHSRPDPLVTTWWLVILMACAAVCLVSVIRPADAGEVLPDAGGDARDAGTRGAGGWRGVLRRNPDRVRPLGWRAMVTLTAGVLLIVAEPFVDRSLLAIKQLGPNSWSVQARFVSLHVIYFHLGAKVLAVLLALVVLRLSSAPVRRRVLVLAAPTAATALLVRTEFGQYNQNSVKFIFPAAHLTVVQWSALVLVPLLAFAAATWALQRHERKLASGALLAVPAIRR